MSQKKRERRVWIAYLSALIVLGTWQAWSCGGKVELGVEVQGQRLDVVDMHLHPGEWDNIPPSTQTFLSSRFPWPLSLLSRQVGESTLSAEGILSQMDAAGVRAAILFAVYAPRTVGITTNEYVIQEMRKSPQRLYGLASLRVDRWKTERDTQLKALETALKEPGMIGIKLAHAHMHFRMDDPQYYGIYEIAARLEKPVYLHTGTSPFPGTSQEPAYTHPAYLEDAIQKHPKAIFILGHLGYDFVNTKVGALDECIRLAKAYPNVYLEPSAFGSAGSDPTGVNLPEAMKKMRDAGVVDRIIYGSDGPQSPGFVRNYLQRTLKAMQTNNYTLEETRQVLSENFVRVFKLPASQP